MEKELFTVNDRNMIQNFGKFECEHISIPYFYEMGCNDEIEFPDGQLYQFFVISEEDRKEFPDLKDYGLCLYETDQGFVNTSWYETKEEYEAEFSRLDEEAAEEWEEAGE